MSTVMSELMSKQPETTSIQPEISSSESDVDLSSVFGPPSTKEEVLANLKKDSETYQKFLTFPPKEREKLLSFMAGQHGLKITYDSFFQKIMSPHLHPERLESFLSALLNEPVHIEKILPREGNRLTYESHIIIMDILVLLSDGSRINVEIQKIGLLFPGERSSCYVADSIMKEYDELKGTLKQDFDYKKMKPVYLIILMEESSKHFKDVAPHYIHTQKIQYDSGAKVTSLQNIKYISLDTFRNTVHNIDNKLNAWLTFLSSDTPSDILKLIHAYPEFCELYQEIAEFRRNPKELIYMYSEALTIADNNIAKLMIDQMREELTDLSKQMVEMVAEKDKITADLDKIIADKDKAIADLDKANSDLDKANSKLDKAIADNTIKDAEIIKLKAEIEKLKHSSSNSN